MRTLQSNSTCNPNFYVILRFIRGHVTIFDTCDLDPVLQRVSSALEGGPLNQTSAVGYVGDFWSTLQLGWRCKGCLEGGNIGEGSLASC